VDQKCIHASPENIAPLLLRQSSQHGKHWVSEKVVMNMNSGKINK
jgi:hypothetical protein